MPFTAAALGQRNADWSRVRLQAVTMRQNVSAVASALNQSVTLRRGLPPGVVEDLVALMRGKGQVDQAVATLGSGPETAAEDAAVFALLISKYARLQQAFLALERDLPELQGRATA
jgi:hypothetical protein